MPTKVTNSTRGDTSNEVITKTAHMQEFVQKPSLAQDDVMNVYTDKIARESHQYKFFCLSLKSISSSVAYFVQKIDNIIEYQNIKVELIK